MKQLNAGLKLCFIRRERPEGLLHRPGLLWTGFSGKNASQHYESFKRWGILRLGASASLRMTISKPGNVNQAM